MRYLKDLIQDVLKNPKFSIDEVDHNEHDRLLRSIKDGENEMLDMWQEGDGEQDAMFFKRGPSEQIRHVSSSPGKSRSRQGAHLNSTVYRRHLYQAGHSNSADIQ